MKKRVLLIAIVLISFSFFTFISSQEDSYSDCTIYGNCPDQAGSLTNTTILANFTNFTQLLDTPSTYTGEGGDCVAVNAGETGLEFVTCASGSGAVDSVHGGGIYIYENTTTGNVYLFFNETRLNLTIESFNYITLAEYFDNATATFITQNYGNATYILQSQEANLNVNSSEYWNTNIGSLNGINGTQFEEQTGELLGISTSWLQGFINSTVNLFGFLTGEVDPYWSQNFTLYNSTWTSTFNQTYQDAYDYTQNGTFYPNQSNPKGYLNSSSSANVTGQWNFTNHLIIEESTACTPENGLCNQTAGGGGNPFDQDLNTTSNVSFQNVVVQSGENITIGAFPDLPSWTGIGDSDGFNTTDYAIAINDADTYVNVREGGRTGLRVSNEQILETDGNDIEAFRNLVGLDNNISDFDFINATINLCLSNGKCLNDTLSAQEISDIYRRKDNNTFYGNIGVVGNITGTGSITVPFGMVINADQWPFKLFGLGDTGMYFSSGADGFPGMRLRLIGFDICALGIGGATSNGAIWCLPRTSDPSAGNYANGGSLYIHNILGDYYRPRAYSNDRFVNVTQQEIASVSAGATVFLNTTRGTNYYASWVATQNELLSASNGEIGDRITLFIGNDATPRTISFNQTSMGTQNNVNITGVANKYATIEFMYNGTKWLELGRGAQLN